MKKASFLFCALVVGYGASKGFAAIMALAFAENVTRGGSISFALSFAALWLTGLLDSPRRIVV